MSEIIIFYNGIKIYLEIFGVFWILAVGHFLGKAERRILALERRLWHQDFRDGKVNADTYPH